MKPTGKLVLVLCTVLLAQTASATGIPGTVKVIVPAASTPILPDLARSHAQLLRAYPTFSVYRLPAEFASAIQVTGRSLGTAVEIATDWDTVALRAQKIDTRLTTDVPAVDLLGTHLYIVQFVAPLTDDDAAALKTAGVDYIGYIPQNAALVAAKQGAINALARSAFVQWFSVYDKSLRPPLHKLRVSCPALIVQLAATESTRQHVAQFIADHHAAPIASYLNYVNVRIEDCSELDVIQSDPYVVVIEYAGVDRPSGERDAVSVTAQRTDRPTNTVFQDFIIAPSSWQPFRLGAASYADWVTWSPNSSYRIAIADSGLDGGVYGPPNCTGYGAGNRHPDLPNDAWFNDYFGGCGDDPYNHGSEVTGIAAATPRTTATDGEGANGTFNYAIGVAPNWPLYIQRIIDGGGNLATTYGSELTWANDAYNNNSAVQTHSHNEYFESDGVYNTTAQLYDKAVRDTAEGDYVDTPMPVTISAGNICGGAQSYSDGDCTTMVLSPATAKNVITVGAAESYRPGRPTYCTANLSLTRQPGDFFAASFNNVAYVSRRGTTDGRIKPELIAPATLVSSTFSKSVYARHLCQDDPTAQYDIDTGTSFAAPQAAGACVLLDAKFGTRLTPAMLKAALVGTAKSVWGGADRLYQGTVVARPNSTQGFGRLYLADILKGTTSYRLLDESSFVPFTGAGQSRAGTLNVPDATRPVVLVLAWTDEPAAVPASSTLVRDLDLTVQSGCTVYAGNYMASETTVPQTGCGNPVTHDSTNNVEMIVIPAGTLSSISYTVATRTWGFGTHNQKFALFGSNVY